MRRLECLRTVGKVRDQEFTFDDIYTDSKWRPFKSKEGSYNSVFEKMKDMLDAEHKRLKAARGGSNQSP
jgi:hypothetical protein